jgi:hypothetical protein
MEEKKKIQNDKLTILSHFRHYYFNQMFDWCLEAAFSSNGTEISRAIKFGELLRCAMAMKSPLTLVNTHKPIPGYLELPEKLQIAISKLEEKMELFEDYFELDIKKEYEELVKKNDKNGLDEMGLKIKRLWKDFAENIIKELKNFNEVY